MLPADTLATSSYHDEFTRTRVSHIILIILCTIDITYSYYKNFVWESLSGLQLTCSFVIVGFTLLQQKHYIKKSFWIAGITEKDSSQIGPTHCKTEGWFPCTLWKSGNLKNCIGWMNLFFSLSFMICIYIYVYIYSLCHMQTIQ